MVVPQEMLVEMGDQTAWEVHDALLLCPRSDFEGSAKTRLDNEGPPASLSICSQCLQKVAQDVCTGGRGNRHGELACSIIVFPTLAMRLVRKVLTRYDALLRTVSSLQKSKKKRRNNDVQYRY